MPKCSVIIPVYNHAALTRQCLTTLLAYPPTHCAWEIIVVNDGSRDHTPAMLASFGEQIHVVTHPVNQGFASACNDGARAATGDYLVFLNNDTVPTPGWLDALVEYAEGQPQVAAVGSRLLFPDGTVQHAGVIIGQDRHPWHLYFGFPGDHPAVLKSRRFLIVTAACVLIRRTAFEAEGGFDTAYHNGYEDVDLCLRFNAAGHEVHYCHRSVVYHLESPTRGHKQLEVQHNVTLYRQRWEDKVEQDDFKYYVADGLINVAYLHPYPLGLTVDPRLAIVSQAERLTAADQLLLERAQQVMDLLKENIRQDVRLRQLEDSQKAEGGRRKAEGGSQPSALSTRPSALSTRPSALSTRPSALSTRPSALSPQPSVDIVVPVYNGLDYLKQTVDSVIAHTDLTRHTLTLVDDASPDAAVRDYLLQVRQSSHLNIRVIFNAQNLGFPGTANTGLRLSRGDVILLNADTLVTPGWVDKLQRAAYSASHIATVTPFSNNATIFSIPRFNERNSVPSGYTVETFAALVERVSQRKYPSVPTAHGFCMFIRRDALDTLGVFDESLFGSGYGEENDWCMRAYKAGWSHILDDATYIYHQGQVSFTPEVEATVIPEHLKILERLHPEFIPMISDFCLRNPLRLIQERIQLALAQANVQREAVT